MESVRIRFPAGLDVEASYKGHTLLTAQPEHPGESGRAPSPFDLFLISIAACAGYYVVSFCRTRGLPTDELRLSLEPLRSRDGKRVETVRLRVVLPSSFPEKYERSILRAIDQCSVKRQILDPPRFEVEAARLVAPTDRVRARS